MPTGPAETRSPSTVLRPMTAHVAPWQADRSCRCPRASRAVDDVHRGQAAELAVGVDAACGPRCPQIEAHRRSVRRTEPTSGRQPAHGPAASGGCSGARFESATRSSYRCPRGATAAGVAGDRPTSFDATGTTCSPVAARSISSGAVQYVRGDLALVPRRRSGRRSSATTSRETRRRRRASGHRRAAASSAHGESTSGSTTRARAARRRTRSLVDVCRTARDGVFDAGSWAALGVDERLDARHPTARRRRRYTATKHDARPEWLRPTRRA